LKLTSTSDSHNIPFRLSHSTILNHSEAGRGFAISTCAVPSHDLAPQPKPQADTTATSTAKTDTTASSSLSNPVMKFDDAQIRARIHSGCEALISSEPTITEYDTIVGDGDCGYTLRDGAKNVLAFIEDKDLSALPETLAALVRDLEVNMGGTSGALYCIFLTALAASLATEETFPKALKGALEQLLKFTRARLGDRTMMDALIPFVETLEGTEGDVEKALREAVKGVDGTKKMEAKLGRSTYLDESATRGVPDPGAYGLLVLFKGMAEVEG
jgi:dihydroxyacetone kinase